MTMTVNGHGARQPTPCVTPTDGPSTVRTQALMGRLPTKRVDGLLALALFATTLLLCLPNTAAHAAAPRAEFTLEATNGYEVSVEGSGSQVALVVIGHGGRATYWVKGRASNRQLKARFGDLGRIAVRFQPRGKPKRLAPPKRCKGRDRTLSEGVFTGTISFNGEHGYTRVAKTRASGSVRSSQAWRCGGEGSRRGADEHSVLPLLPPGTAVLGAFTPNSRVVFAAVLIGGSEKPDTSLFIAGTTERLGAMRIGRFALAFARPRAFAVAPELAEATVQPPKPFSGSAGFVRGSDSAIGWSGPLAVDLPGARQVALTGPSFTAELARPKSFAEFAALLGRPGL